MLHDTSSAKLAFDKYYLNRLPCSNVLIIFVILHTESLQASNSLTRSATCLTIDTQTEQKNTPFGIIVRAVSSYQ